MITNVTFNVPIGKPNDEEKEEGQVEKEMISIDIMDTITARNFVKVRTNLIATS